MTAHLSSLFEYTYKDPPEFIVFAHSASNRLFYTLDFMIKRIWQSNYVFTDNPDTFEHSDKIKINYSHNFFPQAINVFPLSLLDKTGVDKQFKPIFKVDKHTHYSEDIFSKVFYCISRYEEWQNHFTPDIHQRFEAASSVFKDILHYPFLDKDIALFKAHIQSLYPSFQPKVFYKEIYTYDLDNILAFKGKPIWRSIAALMKHLLKQEYNLFQHRINVLLHHHPDPFEKVYHDIAEWLKEKDIIFFILCRSDTKYDRAAHLTHPDSIRILKQLQHFAHIGLHSSYYSMNDMHLIQREKNMLEHILKQNIIASRQHYLRMNISTTPQLLIQQGIAYDFTMGFATQAGFRAGTSYPFYYYDLNKEKSTSLLMIPFCAMDGAYFNYQHISAEAAITGIQNIQTKIQQIGGYFIPLIHEITLSSLFHPDANVWRTFLLHGRAK